MLHGLSGGGSLAMTPLAQTAQTLERYFAWEKKMQAQYGRIIYRKGG